MARMSIATLLLLKEIFAEFDAEDLVKENPDRVLQELLMQVAVYVKDPNLLGVVHPVVGSATSALRFKLANDAYKNTATNDKPEGRHIGVYV